MPGGFDSDEAFAEHIYSSEGVKSNATPRPKTAELPAGVHDEVRVCGTGNPSNDWFKGREKESRCRKRRVITDIRIKSGEEAFFGTCFRIECSLLFVFGIVMQISIGLEKVWSGDVGSFGVGNRRKTATEQSEAIS